MAINFPTSLDSLTNPTTTSPLNNPSHAGQHSDENDAIEALETKVGINNSADTNSLDYKVNNLNNNRFNGACVVPSFTDNGNGSVTIGSGDYCLPSNVDGSGLIKTYTIAGNTFALTDGSLNYIVANYNSGTPVLQVITDVDLINETTIVPVYTIFRNGNFLHRQDWDALGLALANKVHQSIVKTQRYRRQSGLALSESGTRNLNLTAGIVWTGAVKVTLDAIASATDNIYFWYHNAGVWTQSLITQYNNTQYDNGTNLVNLSGAGTQYAVNWIFRGVEAQKHLYVVLGTGNYNLAQAQAATVPALPTAISSHAVLVGKLIVAENANTTTSIQSAFDTQFSLSTPSTHSDLTNLDYANSGHTGFQESLGYTAENSANKENTTIDTSTLKYPTVNLLKVGIDSVPSSSNNILANQIFS